VWNLILAHIKECILFWPKTAYDIALAGISRNFIDVPLPRRGPPPSPLFRFSLFQMLHTYSSLSPWLRNSLERRATAGALSLQRNVIAPEPPTAASMPRKLGASLPPPHYPTGRPHLPGALTAAPATPCRSRHRRRPRHGRRTARGAHGQCAPSGAAGMGRTGRLRRGARQRHTGQLGVVACRATQTTTPGKSSPWAGIGLALFTFFLFPGFIYSFKISKKSSKFLKFS
jgi:hypothetical protein